MSDFTFTGHESQVNVAERLAELLQAGAESLDLDARIETQGGFQPYLTLRLPSGAEFQITPVLSNLPYQDDIARCDECGNELTKNENADGDSLCRTCWIGYCAARDLDPETGDPIVKEGARA